MLAQCLYDAEQDHVEVAVGIVEAVAASRSFALVAMVDAPRTVHVG